MYKCGLCESKNVSFFCETPAPRRFYHCESCDLIFADPESFLSSAEEKSRYATHQNELLNPGYREFLNQMWGPLRELLSGATGGAPLELRGLDFGCGPSHAFSELAAEDSFQVESYDPYFACRVERGGDVTESADLNQRPNKLYDFVWASEVVEHFNEPHKSWPEMLSLLKPGGFLAVMTEVCVLENFKGWYYHRDPTHVSFYSSKSMDWLAERYGLEILFRQGRVTVFRNN